MAVQRIGNFLPASELLLMQLRRSYPVNDVTLVDPNNAICIIDGEWLVKNASGKLVRATDIATTGNRASLPSHPCFSERGRTDVLSAPEPALDIIQGATDSLWRTRVFDDAVTVGSGAPITFVGQPLKVATINIASPWGTRKFSGLVGHGGSGDSDPIVAYVDTLASGIDPMTIQLGGRR